MRTLFALLTLLGLWLFISPFALGYLGAGRGNALCVGGVVMVLGLLGVAGTVTMRKR